MQGTYFRFYGEGGVSEFLEGLKSFELGFIGCIIYEPSFIASGVDEKWCGG